MPGDSLFPYVKRLLEKGYTPEYLRTELIKRGYSPTQVNDALARAGSPNTSLFSWKLFGIIGVVLLLLTIGGGLFFWLFTGTEVITVSLSLQPQTTSIVAAETLSFSTIIKSSSPNPISVRTTYDILEDERVVQTEQDGITVRKESTNIKRITLDEGLLPGTYTLRTTIKKGETTKQKSFDFIITPSTTRTGTTIPVTTSPTLSLEECSSSCDDFNSCTDDFCQSGRCVNVQRVPCCGNGHCESSESVLSCQADCGSTAGTSEDLTTRAAQLSSGDKDGAARTCNRIGNTISRDECYITLAEQSKDDNFCKLVSAARSDSCHLGLALEGNTNVCVEIQNAQLQHSCFNYARFASLQVPNA